MTKTGADHIKSLRDGRSVYLDGRLIEDVVDDPAYRKPSARWRVYTTTRRRPSTWS